MIDVGYINKGIDFEIEVESKTDITKQSERERERWIDRDQNGQPHAAAPL